MVTRKQFILKIPEGQINRKYYNTLWKLDTCNENNLKIVPKLTESHINSLTLHNMRVKLATQVRPTKFCINRTIIITCFHAFGYSAMQ